jgi:hypothetical protein
MFAREMSRFQKSCGEVPCNYAPYKCILW